MRTCPICHASGGRSVETIAYTEIFAALRETWGVTIPDGIAQRHIQPGGIATLIRCEECGLEYFRDAIPADGEFYAAVISGRLSYEVNRWEFGMVRRQLRADDRLVDFGSGPGHFLAAAAELVSRAAGVDYNDDAIRTLRERGIEAHSDRFDDFAQAHQGAFTVATAFHVIEHVPDVAALVGAAHQSLAPGGRLYVSTPNRERFRTTLEPLDCPPHHLSRWSPRQFQEVADRSGFELARVAYELPRDYAGHVLTRRTDRLPSPFDRAVRALVWRSGAVPVAARYLHRAHGAAGPTMLAEFVRR